MAAQKPPVIAIAGLAVETSTFTPSRTLAPFFKPQRGDEIFDYRANPFLRPGAPLREAAEWCPALTGHALPGGQVTREAFEELSQEICDRLAAIVKDKGTLDGFWYDIHGAMVVEGMDDAEGVLLKRIRKIIGPEPIVSASMDLHGNVSLDLVHQCDLINCYRTAPHVDVVETRERAVRNLLKVVSQHPVVRPAKAWIPIPILLPGEQTSTRLPPADRLYDAVAPVADGTGVIDASIWVGYAWADEPRNKAVIVVTGRDEAACAQGAEKLARMFWNARSEFQFVAPTGTLGGALDSAVRSGKHDRPFFISDSGDNPTAGGSGDVTWGLTQLLARPEFKAPDGPVVIYASVPGPEAVAEAVRAGVGAHVTVTAGAAVDSQHAGPVTFSGRVHAIKHGDPHARVEIVIQVGSVYAILTELRKPYHKERDFTDLDLRPREADVVIVKIGYLEPELYDMAKGWVLALTPGGVDQDLKRLGHYRIDRPMWPFDEVFATEPDLWARMIPASNEPL